MKTYYTYLWLREDGTPYYVGKGSGKRAFQKHGRFVVPPRERILTQDFPDECSAFAAEIFLIGFYGRRDTGAGRLVNRTDGGENPPSPKGKHLSAATKAKLSALKKGIPQPWQKGKPKPGTSRGLRGNKNSVGKNLGPRSLETRRKLSDAAKRRYAPQNR